MTRRDAIAVAAGAIAGATIVACVYETKSKLSRSSATPSSPARNGAPSTSASQQQAVAEDDPWKVANATLVDQATDCRHRLAASEAQLKKATTRLASLVPDAGPLHDPFNPTTQEDWKYLAKYGVMRAKNFCFPPPDWRPSADQLDAWGLRPDDVPALTKAFAAAAQRMWQATQPACAKIVGVDEANRLGDDACFTIVLHSFPEAQWSADAQLVSNIRAGNTPMPEPDTFDALATRMLAMTHAASDLEIDLAQSFGADLAHEIATGPMPWGTCTVQLGTRLPMPPDEP